MTNECKELKIKDDEDNSNDSCEKKRGRRRLYTEEEKRERSKEAKRKYAHKRYTTDAEYKKQMITNISNYRAKISDELKEYREFKSKNPELFAEQ